MLWELRISLAISLAMPGRAGSSQKKGHYSSETILIVSSARARLLNYGYYRTLCDFLAKLFILLV
ncbi:MAG: hypothetical protein ACJAYG_000916 [Oceanicoccus sp.]|jgi:hypothetical protein